MESSVRSGDAPDCRARAPRCTNRAPAPEHSAVTISPRWAMDAGDGIPCWRGLVARLIDRVGGCSTAAAATAAARRMLHGGDEPQHAGQPSGLNSARPLHRQDVAIALHKERHRRLCVSMGSHTGRDRARRWTVVQGIERRPARRTAPSAAVGSGAGSQAGEERGPPSQGYFAGRSAALAGGRGAPGSQAARSEAALEISRRRQVVPTASRYEACWCVIPASPIAAVMLQCHDRSKSAISHKRLLSNRSKEQATRSPRRRGRAALATATAVSPLQARPRTHCDLGKISAGAVQSFGTISTINTRVGRFVLFCAVCARFPVSK
jgi:hypothetical protein